MHRVRRLASIAVVAALALGGLTACRSDPSVAAYVGSARYTDDTIVRTVEEVLASVPAEQRGQIRPASVREQVVHMLVVRDAARAYAKAEGITVAGPDLRAFAEERRLPPEASFTQLLHGYSTVLDALSAKAAPVAPTEDDQREAYEHAQIQGQPLSQAAPFAEVRKFFDQQTLGPALGLRKLLGEVLSDADISIHPRYGTT
ncbi:MAG TPA: hypothetical protein VER39_02785, partial [Nocardioidaceae bacterium]|nr:hypothetical protein [Nocardioidaceae bacterium]